MPGCSIASISCGLHPPFRVVRVLRGSHFHSSCSLPSSVPYPSSMWRYRKDSKPLLAIRRALQNANDHAASLANCMTVLRGSSVGTLAIAVRHCVYRVWPAPKRFGTLHAFCVPVPKENRSEGSEWKLGWDRTGKSLHGPDDRPAGFHLLGRISA